MNVNTALLRCARAGIVPLLLLNLTLVACGGGGSDDSGAAATPTTPPVTTATSVTFTGTSVSVAGSNLTSGFALEDESIGFTVVNRPSAGVWTRTTINNVAVGAASVQWPAVGQGKLRLVFYAASSLAAGTYAGMVKIEVCLDADCEQQVGGSPTNIAVTYVVTGNALPTTQLYWTESFITGADLTTSETRSPQMTLRISTSNLPPGGLYLRHAPSATGLITGVVFSQPGFSPQVGVAVGQYDITLKAPAALGSGMFTDTMLFEACFDSACASVVPGSRYPLNISVVIPATEGLEFTRRSLTTSNGATEVIWSPADQSLYLNASAGGPSPQLARVNPLTMAIGASVALPGENLQHMAVSSDASYLYVGSRTMPVVHRLQLPSLTENLSIPLGNFNSFNPYLVNDFAMIPGQPQSFIVAIKWNYYHGGIKVYDNATARPALIGEDPNQAFEYARWLVPGATAGTFISMRYGPSHPMVNTFEQLSLDATGISTAVSTPYTDIDGVRIWPKPQRAGTKLYTFNGKILDAATGALLGTVPNATGAYAVLPDEARGRIFVWNQVNQRDMILSYDMTTLQLLALAPVYGGPTSLMAPPTRSMTLWGTDGIALTDGTNLIVLSGAFFTNYRGLPTL